jgi:cell division protein ZapA
MRMLSAPASGGEGGGAADAVRSEQVRESAAPRQSTTVEICGTEYRIFADAPPEYIAEVARYVDQMMQRVHERAQISSTARLAILTALHIADQLFREREKRADVLSRVDEKAEMLRLLIEQSDTDLPSQASATRRGASVRGSRAE